MINATWYCQNLVLMTTNSILFMPNHWYYKAHGPIGPTHVSPKTSLGLAWSIRTHLSSFLFSSMPHKTMCQVPKCSGYGTTRAKITALFVATVPVHSHTYWLNVMLLSHKRDTPGDTILFCSACNRILRSTSPTAILILSHCKSPLLTLSKLVKKPLAGRNQTPVCLTEPMIGDSWLTLMATQWFSLLVFAPQHSDQTSQSGQKSWRKWFSSSSHVP